MGSSSSSSCLNDTLCDDPKNLGSCLWPELIDIDGVVAVFASTSTIGDDFLSCSLFKCSVLFSFLAMAASLIDSRANASLLLPSPSSLYPFRPAMKPENAPQVMMPGCI